MASIIDSILEALKRNYVKKYITFEGCGSDSFEVKTELNDILAHRTFFNFEICGDTIRFEVKLIFGVLDPEGDYNLRDVLAMLKHNNGTFGSTSSYLALIESDGVYLATLQSCRTFLNKWDTNDIAAMIDLAYQDIYMSPYFMIDMEPPIAPAIKKFGRPSEGQ